MQALSHHMWKMPSSLVLDCMDMRNHGFNKKGLHSTSEPVSVFALVNLEENMRRFIGLFLLLAVAGFCKESAVLDKVKVFLSDGACANHGLTYGDILKLLDDIESEEFEKNYSFQDIKVINQFIIRLAKMGTVNAEEDEELQRDIDELQNFEKEFLNEFLDELVGFSEELDLEDVLDVVESILAVPEDFALSESQLKMLQNLQKTLEEPSDWDGIKKATQSVLEAFSKN